MASGPEQKGGISADPVPWALTILYAAAEQPWDTRPAGHHLEVEDTPGNWITAVSRDEWSAWTGRRRWNGVEYHGPVTYLGTTNPYRGPRVCSCPRCQSTVEAPLRPN